MVRLQDQAGRAGQAGREQEEGGALNIEIRVLLKDPKADVQAVKEALAYYCEAYGDIKLLSVKAIEEKQESLWGGRR